MEELWAVEPHGGFAGFCWDCRELLKIIRELSKIMDGYIVN
jgi:hypothetical protein